jgi:DNA-binding NtrC family response regulator
MAMKSKDVILVGVRAESLCTSGAEGLSLIESPALESVQEILQDHPGATIVVYNKSGEDTARRILTQVSAAVRHIPVVVLVDVATFEEYYEYMCQGAYDYFEMGEDPIAVERAIRYAPEAVQTAAA